MMGERAHALSSIMGRKLVSSNSIPERRLTKDELRRLPIEDQLIYARTHPMTDREQYAALEAEDRAALFDMTGEFVDWADRDTPPADWGT
ncbi:MAG TPA: hypothetical protein VGF29_10740 [Hyphomicrobiaceae bacterium]